MKIETNILLRGIIAAGDFFCTKINCLFRETLNCSQARHAIEDKLIKMCGMSEDKTDRSKLKLFSCYRRDISRKMKLLCYVASFSYNVSNISDWNEIFYNISYIFDV